MPRTKAERKERTSVRARLTGRCLLCPHFRPSCTYPSRPWDCSTRRTPAPAAARQRRQNLSTSPLQRVRQAELLSAAPLCSSSRCSQGLLRSSLGVPEQVPRLYCWPEAQPTSRRAPRRPRVAERPRLPGSGWGPAARAGKGRRSVSAARGPRPRRTFPSRPQSRALRPVPRWRSGMEAEDLQEDLTCSICLDYFEDPVSIECGHNFCRGCLHRSWAPSGGAFPCPECRQPSGPAALRPNWALARLTEKTRRRRQGPVPPGLCGRHWEALRLFCENDQRPVCLVCKESQEHQAHTMAPIDEAFNSYRVSRL